MASHSCILAWKMRWTEEPGGLQSMGSQRVDTIERLHFTSLHFILIGYNWVYKRIETRVAEQYFSVPLPTITGDINPLSGFPRWR